MKHMLLKATVCLLAFVGAFGIALAASAGTDPREDYREYIEELCGKRAICPELIEALIEQESGWDASAVNGDRIGLMQVDRTVHRERMERLGVEDLSDPYDNILVGVDFLTELFGRHGDPAAVLMQYNAGYSSGSGLGAWEDGRLSSYAETILERAAELERLRGK